MMGVKEPLNDLEQTSESRTLEQIQDLVRLYLAIASLAWKWATIEARIRDFDTRLEQTLSTVPDDLEKMEISELVALYRGLEDRLLTKWDAPIVNDFFAMISYGLLRSVCKEWLRSSSIHNKLLAGQTGIVSTEPTEILNDLASMARRDPTLLRDLRDLEEKLERRSKTGAPFDRNEGLTDIIGPIASEHEEFSNRLSSYLNKFADRSCGELKLESPTLRDDPTALLRAIVQLACTEERDTTQADCLRLEGEQEAANKLRVKPLRALVLNLILRQARARIRDRENLRFHRTRVFAAVRRVFLALGARLVDAGVLSHSHNIFYLEIDEVIRFADGTATILDLDELAILRKEEFERFKSEPAPPDRFETTNGANMDDTFIDSLMNAKADLDSGGKSNRLSGTGCCPGRLRGRVKLVADPATESMEGFDILIAERTDPGWITLISQARGIVVEYGSLLSHTAIVARELAIPTIVAASGVMKQLRTGDVIDIDGATGAISIVTGECELKPAKRPETRVA